MKIVFSRKCLEYSNYHIESPRRVAEAYEILKGRGYEFVEPEPASEAALLKVHSREHVEMIRSGNFFDPDTPAYENIYEYARLAAGGAIQAAKEKSFSLMRPPGHHVGRKGRALGAVTMGFCYFNNIAIAVKGLDLPTLILDIDGHHGNGTQEIFMKDPKVAYVSLHRHPNYPGTGRQSEANCLNFPLPADLGDEKYLKKLDEALSQLDMKKYDLVAVSAGFDSHDGDLASLGLSSQCFRKIGNRIRSLGRPVFGVLEGGYVGENVGNDIDGLVQGMEGR